MTTFGDLLKVADKHLATLNNALYNPEIKELALHPGVVAELVQCAGVLVRYNRKIADAFGTAVPREESVRRAAHRSATLIAQAQTLLGAPPSADPTGPRLAWTLRSTSQTLGCSLDLLASHLTVTDPYANLPVRGEAAVIAATDSARALLHKLSRYTAVTGHLTLATGPEGRQAGTLLLAAALLEGLHGDATPTPISAIPLRLNRDRIPPAPDESLTAALHGLAITTERLRSANPTSSVGTSRYLAMAAAISSEILELLHRQLGQRLHELNMDEPAIALTTTNARTLRTVRARWHGITRYWVLLAPQRGTPTTALATDASDLVIRLGRLLYSDPAWQPGPRSSRQVHPPDRLAPTIESLSRIGLTAIKTIEAWNTIAEHHRAAVNDLAILTALTAADSHLPHQQPARVPMNVRRKISRLLSLYTEAQAHGRAAISDCGDTLLTLCPEQSPTATEIALVRRRATASLPRSPAAVAAADFPLPIAEALTPPPTAVLQPNRKPPHQASSASLRTVRPPSP